MRAGAQQRAVLAGCRLTLGAVGEHDGAAAPAGDGVELDGGREAGAAASAQAGLADAAAQLARRQVGERAVDGEVVAQAERMAGASAGEHARRAGVPLVGERHRLVCDHGVAAAGSDAATSISVEAPPRGTSTGVCFGVGAAGAPRPVPPPARAAQPRLPGPSTYQRRPTAGSARAATATAARRPVRRGQPVAQRTSTAAQTAVTQRAVGTKSQRVRASVPVPRPCTTATGQQA